MTEQEPKAIWQGTSGEQGQGRGSGYGTHAAQSVPESFMSDQPTDTIAGMPVRIWGGLPDGWFGFFAADHGVICVPDGRVLNVQLTERGWEAEKPA